MSQSAPRFTDYTFWLNNASSSSVQSFKTWWTANFSQQIDQLIVNHPDTNTDRMFHAATHMATKIDKAMNRPAPATRWKNSSFIDTWIVKIALLTSPRSQMLDVS